MATGYKRPPITEAVIEIRLEGPIGRDTVDKVQRRLLEKYPFMQETQFVNVEISDDAAIPKIQQQFQGYRLTSKDGTDIALLSQSTVATARLAPYEGWESLIEAARENWTVWKKVVGYRKINRIGVRYINRIDVPASKTDKVRVADYLNFVPVLPLGFPSLATFAINAICAIGNDDYKLVLNAGTVPSPLVETMSFVLDLDLSREIDLPQNDDNLWGFINGMRDHKNFVFEGCITDLTRKLFA